MILFVLLIPHAHPLRFPQAWITRTPTKPILFQLLSRSVHSCEWQIFRHNRRSNFRARWCLSYKWIIIQQTQSCSIQRRDTIYRRPNLYISIIWEWDSRISLLTRLSLTPSPAYDLLTLTRDRIQTGADRRDPTSIEEWPLSMAGTLSLENPLPTRTTEIDRIKTFSQVFHALIFRYSHSGSFLWQTESRFLMKTCSEFSTHSEHVHSHFICSTLGLIFLAHVVISR